MAREILSPIAILDETASAVRRVAAPWLGVIWPALIPLRFLQAHFARDLMDLRAESTEFANVLTGLATTSFIALLVSVWGRAVFVRAVRLGLQSGQPVGREALRTPPHELANALYGTLLVEVLFYLTVWLFLPIPVVLLLSGLAYATVHRTPRPGLFGPLREIVRLLGNGKVIAALFFTFGVAFLLAFLNLFVASHALAWVCSLFLGSDLSRWEHLLSAGFVPTFPFIKFAEPLTFCILFAGAMLVVEPFWLASLSVYVHRSQLRQTGEDLRLRFRQLTQTQP